jgi:uncharacterized protein (DUF1800 family)
MRYSVLISFLLLCSSFQSGNAQKQILGGKNSSHISVQASDNWKPNNRKDSTSAKATISGQGMVYNDYDASRFLYQSTLGSGFQEIKALSGTDFEKWIDLQLNLPAHSILDETNAIYQETVDWFLMNGGDSADVAPVPNWITFQYAWWTQHMNNPDKLRKRVALALSEILVISILSELQGFGRALASYYDVLLTNAFGNYEDLLYQVSLHPAMGFYLSHLNNPKTDTVENTHPDENYAREIMQLFTIGLNELHSDGTNKLDAQGRPIPSYTQKDIKELAKVFTGLGFGGVMPNMYTDTSLFGMGIYLADFTKPMKMFGRFHEPGEKFLLNGSTIIPDGQSGLKDIQDAIKALVNHPNTGPFISKQLIQRLIKSNPSPEFVARIAKVFNNDGNGRRGNLGSVVKAILLDPEARDCDWMLDEHNGQLREPLLRYSHFTSAVDVEQYYGRYWNIGYDFWLNTTQIPLAPPTVFNFFTPGFTPKGEIDKKGLVAPEFQIHNSRTSIGYINQVNAWTIFDYVMYSWEQNEPYAILNLNELEDLAQDPEVLVNRLDILLTHGNLSDRTRSIIKQTLDAFKTGSFRENRVRMALYLMMISPDYAIFK